MFLPPLFCQFSGKGFVQQGGFAGFVGVEYCLYFFPGGIELGKEGFNARDEAVLLGFWWDRNSHIRKYFSCNL